MKIFDFGFLILFLAIIGAVSLANPRECETPQQQTGGA